MANMMENHPLLLGFKNRLNSSDFKLKDKLNLVTNVYKMNVLIPYKDQHIFNWIMATLEEKYSDSNIKKKDLEKMWSLLNLCLENIYKNGIKMHFVKEEMFTLLDRADVESENAVNSIINILQISCKWQEFDNLTASLCLKLVQKDICPETLMSVILAKFAKSDTSNIGLFLSNASRHITTNNMEAFSELCRDGMLKNSTGFQHFFKQIHTADEKYEGSIGVEIFLIYLKNQGDIVLLLQASNHPSISIELRTRLFILAAYLAGQDLYDKGESLLLAKIDVCLENAPDLQKILDKALPLDLDLQHDAGKTGRKLITSRILTESLIQVVDEKGITTNLLHTIQTIHNHHPNVLYMLVPLITNFCFLNQNNKSSHAIFSLLVQLMMKLRQFPKVISKFLVYQKTQPGGEEPVTWLKPFLYELENGFFKVPRKQCVEIWYVLMFHFTQDCSDLEKDERFWHMVAPVLGSLFSCSLLIDVNVPEPIVVKIKTLLGKTYTEIISGVAPLKLSSQGKLIYEELVSNFLGFVHLFSTYKNEEFAEMDEFKDNLLQKIIKEKEIGGYSKLIIQSVNTGSKFKTDLLKIFPLDLKNLEEIKVKSEFSTNTESFGDMDHEDNPVLIAQTLRSYFVQLNASTGRFKNLVNKDLWEDSASWQVEDSKLGDFIAKELLTVLDNPVKFDCNLLKMLPLENLPHALKLGSSLLALNSFFSQESKGSSAVILTRCMFQALIFKYVNPIAFIKLAFSNPEEKLPECLLKQLAIDLFLDIKLIESFAENYEELSGNLTFDDCNYVNFFTIYLGKLASVPGFYKEKQVAAVAFGLQIIKSFMKMAKKDITLEAVPCHVKVAVSLMNIQDDLDSKQEKYVKKVAAVSSETCYSAELLGKLLGVSEGKKWLSSEMMSKAWNSVLGSPIEKENLKVGARILESLDVAEFVNYISQKDHDYKLAHILLTMQPTATTKALRTEKLEKVLFGLIKSDTLNYEERVNLLLRFSEATHSPVSSNVEIAAISFLLVPDGSLTLCSPETATILHTFINHHRIISPRYASFLVQAIRQHINHLALPTEDIDSKLKNLDICSKLSHIFIRMSSNKSEWKSVSKYIVSDLVTALVTVDHQELKQLLVFNIQTLLSMLDDNASKYLSANMKPAANEIFKLILEEFKSSKTNQSRNV